MKRFNGRHDHLIKLLATFRFRDSYYLVFPWADGDLLDLWKRNPDPANLKARLKWASKQFLELAEALSLIHGNHSDDEKRPLYGRHGDLKPENILWFKPPGSSSLGRLVISDFGLGRLHRPTDRRPRRLAGTSTYRPPECDMPDARISRAWDIWSLGCVFLEFTVWMLNGSEAVMREFPASRTGSLRPTKRQFAENLDRDDSFFIIQAGGDGMQSEAKLKASVVEVRITFR